MILTVKIDSGKSIYDYSMALYGGFDNIIDLIKLNPSLINMDCDASFLVDESGNYVLDEFGNRIITGIGGFDKFVGQSLSYDSNVYSPNVPQIGTYVSREVNPIKSISVKDGQSIYDIALMAYGGFDQVVKLFEDSGILSINQTNLKGEVCNFDSTVATDYSLRDVIQKKGLVFSTSIDFGFLLDEDGGYILDEFNNRIIV